MGKIACRALDFDFTMQADDPTLCAHLETTYAGLLATASVAGPLPAYRVIAQDGATTLFFDDVQVGSGVTGFVLALLGWHINQEVTRRSSVRRVLFHASAAERDGVVVMIAGAMESGKTTTVAGLLGRGYRYITDEAVAVDVESLTIESFAKPLAIDRGSWPVLPTLRPACEDWAGEQWQVPPAAVPADIATHAPSPAIVLTPSYREGGKNEFVPLSRATMLQLLAESTFEFLDRPARNLDVAARTVAAATTVGRLHISDLENAVDVIDGLVDEVLGR